MDTKELSLSLVAAIGGSSVLTAFVTSWFNKRQALSVAGKVDADAAATTVDSVLKWADGLTRRIDLLEHILEARNTEIVELKIQITELRNSVEDLKRMQLS